MFQAQTCFNAILRALETQTAIQQPTRIANLVTEPRTPQATVGVVKGVYGTFCRQQNKTGWELLIDDGVDELSVFITHQMGDLVNLGTVIGAELNYRNQCYEVARLHVIGQVENSDVPSLI